MCDLNDDVIINSGLHFKVSHLVELLLTLPKKQRVSFFHEAHLSLRKTLFNV